MPIDTRVKRLSMLTFSSPDLLPDPNVGFDAGDRFTLLELYSGISGAGPPAVVGGIDKITLGTEESFAIKPDPILGGWWGR